MKVGLLTSEKIESAKSLLISLNNYLLSRNISSQIISPWMINPDISSLKDYDVIMVRILECKYLWLAQHLEEMGIKVINSYRALSLSSNKLTSDEIMKGALGCFHSMEIEIGGMDFIEGKDGYYALEVNDFPAGVKRIENWLELITDYLVKAVHRSREDKAL